jgi:peptidoglycan hydrolase-like protein with peptidoglycan-binding domain
MEFEKPISDMEYKLNIDGKEFEGKTDSEGRIKRAISPNAKLAKLVLANGTKYDLKLGRLDPVDEVTGIQGRLQSLGFYEGAINGKMNDETKSALMLFKRSHDLEASGEADEQTKARLVEMAGT